MHSLIHLFIYSLIHLLIHSLTHLLAHLFTHSLSHSLYSSLTRSLIHLLLHSLSHSFNHSAIHSLTYSLIHSLSSLTHSLTHSQVCTWPWLLEEILTGVGATILVQRPTNMVAGSQGWEVWERREFGQEADFFLHLAMAVQQCHFPGRSLQTEGMVHVGSIWRYVRETEEPVGCGREGSGPHSPKPWCWILYPALPCRGNWEFAADRGLIPFPSGVDCFGVRRDESGVYGGSIAEGKTGVSLRGAA